MKCYAGSLVLVAVSCCFLLVTTPAGAQGNRIEIAAGTPEDHELQAITNEPDSAKKLAMYQDFVQKYSSNPAAVVLSRDSVSLIAVTATKARGLPAAWTRRCPANSSPSIPGIWRSSSPIWGRKPSANLIADRPA